MKENKEDILDKILDDLDEEIQMFREQARRLAGEGEEKNNE